MNRKLYLFMKQRIAVRIVALLAIILVLATFYRVTRRTSLFTQAHEVGVIPSATQRPGSYYVTTGNQYTWIDRSRVLVTLPMSAEILNFDTKQSVPLDYDRPVRRRVSDITRDGRWVLWEEPYGAGRRLVATSADLKTTLFRQPGLRFALRGIWFPDGRGYVDAESRSLSQPPVISVTSLAAHTTVSLPSELSSDRILGFDGPRALP